MTLLALVALLLAFPIVFFWLVAPANAAFRGAVGDPVPANRSAMRDSWELGHTLRFVLQLMGFGALVSSVLGGRRRDAG